MEDRLTSYNKLTTLEETTADDNPLYSNHEKQQVSMSTVRRESIWSHHRLLTVSLAVLAAILLALDIGLGVYYNNLTDGAIIKDISGEISKLQASYNAEVQSRNDAKEQLVKEINEQLVTKWELDHQIRRSNDYENKAEKLRLDIAGLNSHLPMIEDGCRHCLPGWTFLNSRCYYFPFSDHIARTSWQDARQFCKRQGGDLAIVDTREKHLAIANLINNYKDPTRPFTQSGFWIGLRDIEDEGTWKWLDGTILTEGYWNDGEPNNQNNEDCAAVYPKINPFKVWNDAPCNYSLKWICEMASRSAD